MTPAQDHSQPVGEILRTQRVDVMKKSLRETARLLDIAPAHLTDIEKGRRSPSEALLMRIARVYDIDESTLRAGWGKAETIVGEIASESALTAAKAPELLRAARDLKPEQWDDLIRQARNLSSKLSKKAKRG